MTDREKLIAIIDDCRTYVAKKEELADHLLANGVTFQDWIPVSERLPEELPKDSPEWSVMIRPSVDVVVKMKGSKQLDTAWYSYSYKEWADVREEHVLNNVTHWMPLSELPKENK